MSRLNEGSHSEICLNRADDVFVHPFRKHVLRFHIVTFNWINLWKQNTSFLVFLLSLTCYGCFLSPWDLHVGVETTRLKERRLEVFIFLVEVNDILLLHWIGILFRSIDTLSVIYFALKVKDIIRLHVNHFISTISRKLTKVGIYHIESANPLNHRPSHLHASTKFFLVTNQEHFEFFFFLHFPYTWS